MDIGQGTERLVCVEIPTWDRLLKTAPRKTAPRKIRTERLIAVVIPPYRKKNKASLASRLFNSTKKRAGKQSGDRDRDQYTRLDIGSTSYSKTARPPLAVSSGKGQKHGLATKKTFGPTKAFPSQKKFVQSLKGKEVRRASKYSDSDADDGGELRDIHSELEHLKQSAKYRAIATTSTKRLKKKESNFVEALSKLKRRKQGKASESSSSSEDSDSDSDDQTIRSHRRANARDLSFIVDDEGRDLEKARDQIPDEFKLSTHQQLYVDFKIYCQYLLNCAIFREEFSGFQNPDAYFKHSVDRIVRTLASYQTSLSSSQLWKKRFRRQLDRRPEFQGQELTIVTSGNRCDACQSTTRPVTHRCVLSGPRYKLPESLRDPTEVDDYRDLGSDSDDDASTDSDDSVYEEDKEVNISYQMGRFCYKRSKTFHAFRHWSYYCAKSLECRAMRLDKNTLQKGRQSRAEIDTNALMDRLEESGYVRKLFRELKGLMNTAENLSPGQD